MFSKAIQSLFLVAGVVILSSFFFGGRWGPALIGVGVFLSAFPPVRRHFDRWLVGTTRGEEADQAAVLRMAAGGFICIAAIVFFR